MIRRLLATGMAMRVIAKLVKVDKDTVARRLLILGHLARVNHNAWLAQLPKASCVQLDDLITFEHTKMKPLTLTVVSNSDLYCFMGLKVSQIPANGLLAKKAREKYGPRPDESVLGRKRALARCVKHLFNGVCRN